MGALQVDKTSQWWDCSSRCLGANGIRRTRKRIWIHGWPAPVCEYCLKSLVEVWDETLERIRDEELAA